MLNDGDRQSYIHKLKAKLKNIVDNTATTTATTTTTTTNNDDYCTDDSDLKGLLEEALELGALAIDDEEQVIEKAIKFDNASSTPDNTNLSVMPSIKKIFYDPDVQHRLASKVGYYEMLDIAGKYLYQQRLYQKVKRNKIVENYIIVGLILVLLGTAVGWYTNLSIYFSCQKNNNKDSADYSCTSSEFGMYFQLGYFIFFLNLTLNIWGMVATFSGLVYGSFICHTLVDSFMRRYKMLRKLKIPSSFSDMKDKDSEEQTKIKENQIKFIETVASYLKRDCYERYIFIKILMEQISQIWSGILTGVLIVCSILLVYFYSLILVFGPSPTYILIAFINAIIFLTPTVCCSYANSAMDLLFFKLKTSGPGDYSVIGGRDEFIEYATNTPCYWYIFGFAITPSWLAGFVGGTVSALAASILVTQFTPSSS